MKTDFELLREQKILIFSLITIGLIFLIANLVNQVEFPIVDGWYVTDILYIIVPGIAIVFGVIISAKYRGLGNHGKAWIFLTLALISWFTADQLWNYQIEGELEEFSNLTSESFYILGYPLFFAFTLFYLKPRKRIITKKIILSSILASLILIIPSIYISLNLEEEELELTGAFFAVLYPILDGIILVPALIGLILFFRGQVNLLWTLLMFGLLCIVIGDTLYLGSYIDDSYYPGHISDLFFVWGYLFFAFGVYSHLKIFKTASYSYKFT